MKGIRFIGRSGRGIKFINKSGRKLIIHLKGVPGNDVEEISRDLERNGLSDAAAMIRRGFSKDAAFILSNEEKSKRLIECKMIMDVYDVPKERPDERDLLASDIVIGEGQKEVVLDEALISRGVIRSVPLASFAPIMGGVENTAWELFVEEWNSIGIDPETDLTDTEKERFLTVIADGKTKNMLWYGSYCGPASANAYEATNGLDCSCKLHDIHFKDPRVDVTLQKSARILMNANMISPSLKGYSKAIAGPLLPPACEAWRLYLYKRPELIAVLLLTLIVILSFSGLLCILVPRNTKRKVDKSLNK